MRLPVGPHPGWELENDNESNVLDQGSSTALHSIADSLVVLQSLRQSRNQWLISSFPKFSAKARGGRPADVVPPAHTIKSHGRFDLKIGPHVFSNSTLYEVHYSPQPPAALTGVPLLVPATYGTQPSAFNLQTPAYPHSAAYPAPPAPAQLPELLASSGADVFVTPALIEQVTAASSSDPTLAHYIHLARSQQATPDQMRTLGILIQSIGALQPPPPNNTLTAAPPAAAPPVPSPPVKEFDIVLEFHEKSSDKWIFPRGPVFCERVAPEGHSELNANSRVFDILITTLMPFAGAAQPPVAKGQSPSEESTSPPTANATQPVTFRFSRTSHGVWDLLMQWAGGEEKMEENKKTIYEAHKKSPARSYLQYQLPDSPLLSELEAATAPSYAMKSIRPTHADSTRARRRTAARKSQANANKSGGPSAKETTAKARQSAKQQKVASAPTIACHLCGQINVPLLSGGRFCRACLDRSQGRPDIPQTALHMNGGPMMQTYTMPYPTYNPYSMPMGAPNVPGPQTPGIMAPPLTLSQQPATHVAAPSVAEARASSENTIV